MTRMALTKIKLTTEITHRDDDVCSNPSILHDDSKNHT